MDGCAALALAALPDVSFGGGCRNNAVMQTVASSFLGARKIMTLKIERISGKRRARIRLIGQFRSDRLDQVKAEISHGGPAVLDLEEVDLVDVEAIRFLNAREDEGISVLHCSPYIREWMLREREEEKGRTDWR
jgi:hypothetical protein